MKAPARPQPHVSAEMLAAGLAVLRSASGRVDAKRRHSFALDPLALPQTLAAMFRAMLAARAQGARDPTAAARQRRRRARLAAAAGKAKPVRTRRGG